MPCGTKRVPHDGQTLMKDVNSLRKAAQPNSPLVQTGGLPLVAHPQHTGTFGG